MHLDAQKAQQSAATPSDPSFEAMMLASSGFPQAASCSGANRALRCTVCMAPRQVCFHRISSISIKSEGSEIFNSIGAPYHTARTV